MADPIRIQSGQPVQNTPQTSANSARPSVTGSSFADLLAQAQDLKFSNHAQKRVETRNLAMSDDGLNRLSTAIDRAEKRGGKESLVLIDDMAFLVNVPQRLVITALDTKKCGEGVFTQIDSVVFADPKPTTDKSA
jgi:flagellar operon protein